MKKLLDVICEGLEPALFGTKLRSMATWFTGALLGLALLAIGFPVVTKYQVWEYIVSLACVGFLVIGTCVAGEFGFGLFEEDDEGK